MSNIQELSRADRIQNELNEAKRTAHRSIGLGVSTLEALNEQDEILRGTEDTLEATEQLANRSMVALRGMTWAGYLYNKCADTSGIIFSQPPGGGITAEDRSNTVNNGNSSAEPNSSGLHSPLSTGRDKDDLQEISAAVATLHQMGLDIGNQIDMQNGMIDSLSSKTEHVTEKTLAVTIKASQLRDRARGSRAKYGGMYQFLDTATKHFLAVKDGRLILSPTLTRSTYFNCFVKETNLFAMQNEKYQKFVGCAFLGHIVAESVYFGTQEEIFIDFKAKTTGILFIARHWGAGGWLKRPLGVPVGAPEGTAPPHPYLTETTTGIEDKDGWIQFEVIKLDAKEKLVEDDV